MRRSPLRRTVYAFWVLGGVPRRHCSDSLSAAVNDLSAKREFRAWYEGLLNHYGVRDERINCVSRTRTAIRSRHTVTSRPAVDQALQLRGSRDFASLDHYQTFLRQVLDKRNAAHRERHAEEVALFRPLPTARLESRLCLAVTVAIGRLVHRNWEASRASMASGRHGDALPAQQKERASRAAAPLAFAFHARTIWNGSAAAWQFFVVA